MFIYIGKYRNHKSVSFGQTLVNFFFNSWWTKLSRLKFIHIHRHDTYTAVHPMAEVNYQLMKKFNEVSLEKGYKYTDREDAPSSRFYDDDHERWKWMMKEIEHCFKMLRNDDWEDIFYHEDYIDKEGYVQFQERMQNGLNLYAKYFMGLWW